MKERQLADKEVMSQAQYENRLGMLQRLYQFDVNMKNRIYDYEKYKRNLVQSTNKRRPTAIRVSALQALKAVHKKWEGTIYEHDIERCLVESESSEIKSAAVDFLLHAVFSDEAYKYSRLVVRDTPALCSRQEGQQQMDLWL